VTPTTKRPRGQLTALIDLVWLDGANTTASVTEQILPRGAIDLIVELGEDRAVVVGPSTDPFVLEKPRSWKTLGVVLKPGAAVVLLGVSADELRGKQVPLETFWQTRAAELRERVLAACGRAQKLAEVEHMLLARLACTDRRPDRNVARAAARITAAPERCGIRGLSDALATSRRRLEEKFRAGVGVTLKEYQRLQRFRRAVDHIDAAADLGWATFAVERGYYDQSHFNNEFRAHAGLTPSRYLAARGPFTNHVPMEMTP
jgi:methylphosphotriester-DNA--protein-cysteine methyltransferase